MVIVIPDGVPGRMSPESTAPVIHTLYHTIQSTMVAEPGGGNPSPWHTVDIKGLTKTNLASKTAAGTYSEFRTGLKILLSCYVIYSTTSLLLTTFALY
jgi:hypothetical protein